MQIISPILVTVIAILSTSAANACVTRSPDRDCYTGRLFAPFQPLLSANSNPTLNFVHNQIMHMPIKVACLKGGLEDLQNSHLEVGVNPATHAVAAVAWHELETRAGQTQFLELVQPMIVSPSVQILATGSELKVADPAVQGNSNINFSLVVDTFLETSQSGALAVYQLFVNGYSWPLTMTRSPVFKLSTCFLMK